MERDGDSGCGRLPGICGGGRYAFRLLVTVTMSAVDELLDYQ